jgi:peptidoglycan/LPS O-acetylase OafA/YrhL
MKKPYFASLDGLRAISVFLVITEHIRTKAPWLAHIPGRLGVDIFFVLSGYLITALLLQEQESSGRVDFFAFYMRRLFRIVPIYLLVLAVYLAVCYHSPLKWEQLKFALPYYVTLMNEFVPFGTPYSFSWTLGVEEKFYLLWPLLYFAVLRGRARWTALPFAYVALVGLLSYRMGRSYSGILVGCVLAVVLSKGWLMGLKRAISTIPPYVFAGSVIVGFYLVDRDQRFTFLFSWLVAGLIANLQLRESRLRDILSTRWLTWIGRRSYGMYLIHGIVIDIVESIVRPTNSFRQIAVAVLTYAGASLIAEPLFRFVEEPARRYGKAVVERRAARRSVVHARNIVIEHVGSTT